MNDKKKDLTKSVCSGRADGTDGGRARGREAKAKR